MMSYKNLPSLYAIKSIIILDSEGKKIWAQYYENSVPCKKSILEFEKSLFLKTKKVKEGPFLFKKFTVVYKSVKDVNLFVLGNQSENVLLLEATLNCLFETLSNVFNDHLQKSVIYQNMEKLLLAIDEIVDRGVVLQCDAMEVCDRIDVTAAHLPIGEKTVSQLVECAKQKFQQYKYSILH